jgi:hypothetical protein
MSPRWLVFLAALPVACTSAASGPTEVPPQTTAPSATPPAPAPAPSAATTATPRGTVKTLFVDAKRVPCEGEGVTECLRVRESPTGEWTLFYRTIEGFRFEPGNTYELRVEVTAVSDAPADASSLHHRLVEIVSMKTSP